MRISNIPLDTVISVDVTREAEIHLIRQYYFHYTIREYWHPFRKSTQNYSLWSVSSL